MKKTTLFVLMLGIGLLGAPAWLDAGTVKALRVVGEVRLLEDATGMDETLERGRIFGEGFTVISHEESNALLVFSNGVTLRVGPESSVGMTELVQEAFSPERGAYQTLTEEPSRSEMRVSLNYGTVTGQARLREDSTFDVATDVGVAGIRGTRFQVTFTREVDDDGRERLRMTVINIEGTVLVRSLDVTEIAAFTPVESGTSAEVARDDDTGTVTYTAVTEAQAGQILEIIEEMARVVAEEAEAVDPGIDPEPEPEPEPEPVPPQAQLPETIGIDTAQDAGSVISPADVD